MKFSGCTVCLLSDERTLRKTTNTFGLSRTTASVTIWRLACAISILLHPGCSTYDYDNIVTESDVEVQDKVTESHNA